MTRLKPLHDKDWWLEFAACKGPEAAGVNFFPVRGEDTQPAKDICQMCDSKVREACLVEALAYPATEDKGIRGGLSERQRLRLRGHKR